MLVLLGDTTGVSADDLLKDYPARSVASARAGASDLRAPACSTGSTLELAPQSGLVSNMPLILPHNLLDKSRLIRLKRTHKTH